MAKIANAICHMANIATSQRKEASHMASIRPIKNKEGEITSYQITVSAGRVGGKQVRKYKTWTPAPA